MRKWLFGIVVLVLVVVGGGMGWHFYGNKASGSTFRTEPAEHGNLLAEISATGTVEPEDVIDVGAQVAGMIQELGVDQETGKPIDYRSNVKGPSAQPRDNAAAVGAVAGLVGEVDVKPGTLLARIDDRLYRSAYEQSVAHEQSALAKWDSAKTKVDQAESNLQRAQANLVQAKATATQAGRDWDRARSTRGSQVLAPADIDAFQAAYETAKAGIGVNDAAVAQAVSGIADSKAAVADAWAAVKEARAALLKDKTNLEYTQITSPVDGVIIDRRVSLGQTVQSSFNTPSLFLLAKDLRRMKVWASVNEADVGQVKLGQTVRFTVDAYPGVDFKGVVGLIRLNATSTQNVVTYTVEVVTDNSDGKLLPYMTANLHFEVDRLSNVQLVPNSALRWKPQPDQIAPDVRDEFAKKKGKGGGQGPGGPGKGEATNKGMVWKQDGAFVRPVKLVLGPTDGNNTRVLKGELNDGDALIVGENRSGGDAGSTTNPFTPQMFGGQKKQQ
jgi:HlyD family secretion protein